MQDHAATRHLFVIWAAIILILVAARVHQRYHSPIIMRDGVRFAMLAQTFLAEPARLLTSRTQEPIYPILLARVEAIMRSLNVGSVKAWEYAGLTLGIMSSVIIAFAVYLIGREMFGQHVGLLAALLAGLIPKLVSLSANVMSEPVFLAFLAMSVACFLLATRSNLFLTFVMALLAGALALAAFLTRKEGVIVLSVYAMFLVLPGIGLTVKKRLIVLVMLGAGVAVSLSGYTLAGGRLNWVGQYRRNWVVKIFARSTASPTPQARVERIPRIVAAKTLRTRRELVWEPIHRLIKLCPWPVALAAMAYPVVRKRYQARRSALLLTGIVFGYWAVVYLHAWRYNFLVARYLFPGAVLVMPLAAATIFEIAHIARDRVSDRGSSGMRAHLLAGGIVGLFCAASVVGAACPKVSKAINILEAAEWVKANSKPSDRIFTCERRISFYAEREAVDYHPWTFAGSQDYRHAAYVVFFQTRGEEWIKDRFFKVVRAKKLPVPECVKTITSTRGYDVDIYRP